MINPALIKQCLDEKAVKVAEILSAPSGAFLVCEGCGSVVKSSAAVCPACHAYRFDSDRGRLIEVCGVLSKNPFPTYQYTVPRIELKVVDKVMDEPQIVE